MHLRHLSSSSWLLSAWLLATCFAAAGCGRSNEDPSHTAAPPAGTGATATRGSSAPSGAVATGWLYTEGNKIHVRDGAASVWVGRGVNIDDLFHCGYNFDLSHPGEAMLADIVSNLMRDWKPTFVRISLGMNSYSEQVSWTQNPSQYRTSMENIIDQLGSYPGTYVLVTLRSDVSMTRLCGGSNDATCLPNAETASDDLYRAMVDSFAAMPHVLIGISNEPGGQSATDSDLRAVMTHALTVIRAEEDKLSVPHHLVSVQGNQWTSRIGFYNSAPLPFDNVVYEYHSYPPDAPGYTQTAIPVIIGEYGPAPGQTTLAAADAFYADVETKQIPSLAWDLSPYSDCAPDLVSVTHTSMLSPVAWGSTVKSYLNDHAR